MAGVRLGAAALLLLYTATVAGAALGVNTGYEADTAADTDIYIEGETLVAGDNESDASLNYTEDSQTASGPALPVGDGYGESVPQLLPDAVADRLESGVRGLTERAYWSMLTVAIGVADWTATWTYHNRWWLPAWVASGGLQGLAVVPIVGVGYASMRRVWGTGR